MDRTGRFTESVIRKMTRMAHQHDAVNLSQGFPDFPLDPRVEEAAIKAIKDGYNQYTFTWGLPELRTKIAERILPAKGMLLDPDSEVVITCGDAEALMAAVLALAGPGDRVLLLEPVFENYLPGTHLSGAEPIMCPLNEEDFGLDPEALKNAFAQKPALVILNSPHNPTGRAFGRDELELLARLCIENDSIVLTDETYDRLLYDDRKHVSIAQIEGMAERTLITGSFSKTYGITGWRVGYAAGPEKLLTPVRKVHDYLTVCAPAPFQKAVCDCLDLPQSYYQNLVDTYDQNRRLLHDGLSRLGFGSYTPQGAYYIFADIEPLGWEDDFEFAEDLVSRVGVAAVPGSSFYRDRSGGRRNVRFSFSRKPETIRLALQRMREHGIFKDSCQCL